MAAPADPLPSAPCGDPGDDAGYQGGAEPPLTAEPPMGGGEDTPLTSEPPLPEEPPLTSEPTTHGYGTGVLEV